MNIVHIHLMKSDKGKFYTSDQIELERKNKSDQSGHWTLSFRRTNQKSFPAFSDCFWNWRIYIFVFILFFFLSFFRSSIRLKRDSFFLEWFNVGITVIQCPYNIPERFKNCIQSGFSLCCIEITFDQSDRLRFSFDARTYGNTGNIIHI